MFWLVLLISEIVLEIVVTALFPLSRGYFFNQLAGYTAYIWIGIGLMYLNSLGFDLLQSVKGYFVNRVMLNKRSLKTFSLFNIDFNTVTNTAQRIQEDIKLMYLNSITAKTEYVISGGILVCILLANLHQPLLLLSASIYAIVSIGIAFLFKPKMIHAEKIVQNSEADFRTTLRIDSFYDTQSANIEAAKIRRNYSIFSKVQNSLVLVLPYIILLPLYIAKTITMGDLVGAATTFGLIVVNADILISMFPIYTIAKASEERVNELIKED